MVELRVGVQKCQNEYEIVWIFGILRPYYAFGSNEWNNYALDYEKHWKLDDPIEEKVQNINGVSLAFSILTNLLGWK